MRYIPLKLAEVGLVLPAKHEDVRGHFFEAFRDNWFREHVSDVTFVQENQSLSIDSGTIRGLHYQSAPLGQGKLVRCLKGAIYDVVVDIHPKSETFGQWVGTRLTEEGCEQLWVPEGFAHGYCTLVPETVVFYKVTSYYSPEHERGLAFDDPDIAIDWPIDLTRAILSDKDKSQLGLKDLRA